MCAYVDDALCKKKRVKTNIKQKKHKDLHLPFSIDDEFNFNAFLFQCLLTLYMIIIICYYLLMQLEFYLIFNSTGHTNMVWSVATQHRVLQNGKHIQYFIVLLAQYFIFVFEIRNSELKTANVMAFRWNYSQFCEFSSLNIFFFLCRNWKIGCFLFGLPHFCIYKHEFTNCMHLRTDSFWYCDILCLYIMYLSM